MKLHLFSSKQDEGKLSYEKIERNVYDAVIRHINSMEKKFPPDLITVVISGTVAEFNNIIKPALYASVDALYKISKIKFNNFLPTIEVKLQVIHDPLTEKGEMNIKTLCVNELAPNIIPDTGATGTNVNYQSIEPYFNKECLHFMAREFNPETCEMVIRWQFNGRESAGSSATFKVAVSNPGLRFAENHSHEYMLYGNEKRLLISGQDALASSARSGEILHIENLDSSAELLEVRYNEGKGIWEYRTYTSNTYIKGEALERPDNDNYWPFEWNEPMSITVDGIGLSLEPIGRPTIRK